VRVSAFTFAKNAVRMNYPLREAILSVLPVADEVIVNVGMPDEDGTLEIVDGIGDPKIKIIKSIWNPNINFGGYVLSQQTNISLFNCTGNWAIYFQADEVFHEVDYDILIDHMKRLQNDDRIEALSVNRIHFLGAFKQLLTHTETNACAVSLNLTGLFYHAETPQGLQFTQNTRNMAAEFELWRWMRGCTTMDWSYRGRLIRRAPK